MAARNGRKRAARVKKKNVIPPINPDDALEHVHDARSIFACVARCLDEITDAHWLESEDRCVPVDVAVIVRLGLETLDKAAAILDPRPVTVDGEEGDTP